VWKAYRETDGDDDAYSHRHDSWNVVYGHVGDMSTLISEARGWREAGGLFNQMLGIAKCNTSDVPSALR
jgi:hypothetical protein